MKYIVLCIEREEVQQEVPIIFPPFLVHSDVAKYTIRQLHREHNILDVVPVAAGFINFNGRIHCHGKSETLNLESRGVQDSVLISTYDYMHGLV